MPKNVEAKLARQAFEAREAGKVVVHPYLLYFGKSDVNHQEGFKLAEGVAVTFQVYVDHDGAGAYEVSLASLLTLPR